MGGADSGWTNILVRFVRRFTNEVARLFIDAKQQFSGIDGCLRLHYALYAYGTGPAAVGVYGGITVGTSHSVFGCVW